MHVFEIFLHFFYFSKIVSSFIKSTEFTLIGFEVFPDFFFGTTRPLIYEQILHLFYCHSLVDPFYPCIYNFSPTLAFDHLSLALTLLFFSSSIILFIASKELYIVRLSILDQIKYLHF